MRVLDLLKPATPGVMTGEHRFHDYVKNVIGIVPLVSAGAGAGFNQWMNSPKEWGQSGSGYAKRFANDAATNAVRQTITFTTAALLREDNRYFASGKDRVFSRVTYALASPVIARHENGHCAFSVAGISGIVGAALISRAWVPPSWQGGRNVAANVGITFATTAGFNLAREFVPDLIRHFQGR